MGTRWPHLNLRRAALALSPALLLACGGDGAGDGPADEPPDMFAVEVTFQCDTTTRRALPSLPPAAYACATAPETVTLATDRGRRFEVFAYEASHPLADGTAAFPCARYKPADGERLVGVMQAPRVPAEACSQPGVRPWHSVQWEDARAACEAIGWRLCTREELLRSCQGPDGTSYAFGRSFEGGRCNFREAFTAPGASDPSEAPSGTFEQCTAGEGVFDANGNLWEWIADRDASDDRARHYLGAGWKTVAQRHQDSEQTCETDTRLPGSSAASFASEAVGFRCCRDPQP